jgi:hypothetical protein
MEFTIKKDEKNTSMNSELVDALHAVLKKRLLNEAG